MRDLDPDLVYMNEVFRNNKSFSLTDEGQAKFVEQHSFLDPGVWGRENTRRWNILKEIPPGFLMKIQGHHLSMSPEILQEICEYYTPLCLTRRDHFSQVLSNVIGRRTRVWQLWSKDQVREHRKSLKENPILPDEEIEEWIKWFCEELQRHQRRIDNFETKQFIYFEDILSHPEEELRKIGFQIPEGETISFPIPRVNPENHLEAFQNPDQIVDWYEHYRLIA